MNTPSNPFINSPTCKVSDFLAALKQHGPHAVRIVNALAYNPLFINYNDTEKGQWVRFDCRMKKHGSVDVNLGAIIKQISDGRIFGYRSLGKACIKQLCETLKTQDHECKCRQCGRVWSDQ